jgi:hypothetical protein
MGRKPASTSAVLDRKLVGGPEHMPRSAQAADRRHSAHAGRHRSAQSGGTLQLAGLASSKATRNTNPEVIVDFPEFAGVLDRELDAIESYLGAFLDEVLGSMDLAKEEPPRNGVGEGSCQCNNQPR